MANDALVPRHPDRGFSLVEMLIVVAIVAVMAAVALPNIGQYIRNYRIKGAATEVAGELEVARSKAIMTNTNNGVSFVVVDRDSYRFVQEDLLPQVAAGTLPAGSQRSPLKNLPQGVEFVVSRRPSPTAGPRCASSAWAASATPPPRGPGRDWPAVPVAEPLRGRRKPTLVDTATSNGLYIGVESTSAVMEIRLRETATSLQRTVRIAPGAAGCCPSHEEPNHERHGS